MFWIVIGLSKTFLPIFFYIQTIKANPLLISLMRNTFRSKRVKYIVENHSIDPNKVVNQWPKKRHVPCCVPQLENGSNNRP